ncbi:hypothetical protein D3C72_2076010 [compost metagenome]
MDCTSRLVSSFTSRAMPSWGDSPASMKPVISANILPGQAALRASSTLPSISTIAASTGVGLFQWVQPQAGQRSRSLSPPSSARVMGCSAVPQWVQ